MKSPLGYSARRYNSGPKFTVIDFDKYTFHPVINIGKDFEVLDLSSPTKRKAGKHTFTIGRYNEKREGLYTSDLFSDQRNLHVGLDIGGPVGTKIFAPYEGEIFDFTDHKDPGNYGPTIILRLDLDSNYLYLLFGHLRRDSISGLIKGQSVAAGDLIGWIGAEFENGGWPPHLHFQLSWEEPLNCDLPGVVQESERAEALRKYPDPQLIMGKLY